MSIRYIKNVIKNLTPAGIKAANDNFDYLYQKNTSDATEIALINVGDDNDNFKVSYTDKPSATYIMSRGVDTPYISKLSSVSREIKIYHSSLGEYPPSK